MRRTGATKPKIPTTIRTLKCMEPAAQTHFNAQVRRIDTGYQRKAYHVKMHDCSARSSIHRKREARTQPANMTRRLEEKKGRDKKHETSDHARADKRLNKKHILPSHHSKRRRIAKLQDAPRKKKKTQRFVSKLPLKRPHYNWFTRSKSADPRSEWVLLE